VPNSGPPACEDALRKMRVCTENTPAWPNLFRMGREDEEDPGS
jgi:hypothetical protein